MAFLRGRNVPPPLEEQGGKGRRVLALSQVSRVVLVKDKNRSDHVRVLVNPNSLSQRFASDWARQVVVGIGFEPMQYSHARNMEVTVQFYLSAYEHSRGNPNDDFANYDNFRKFLVGACYPFISGESPSAIFFIWANVVSFLGVVEEVSFNYTQFSAGGIPVLYTADVKFTEIRGARLDSTIRGKNRLGVIDAPAVEDIASLTQFTLPPRTGGG